MLGSVGFGEIMLIALVALIVFGPHRLPEIARKIGDLMAMARNATQDLTSALDAEYGNAASPIKDLKAEYDATKQQLKDSVTTFTNLTTVESESIDGAQEPEDTGQHPEDTGQHPEDTGQHPEDTGQHPEDTGQDPEDTGQHPEDAGQDPEDAGQELQEDSFEDTVDGTDVSP